MKNESPIKCSYCNRKIRESQTLQLRNKAHTVCIERHERFNWIVNTQRDWDKYLLELRRENSQDYL